MSIHALSAVEQAQEIRRGDLSPVEVVEAHLARIEERNDRVNAYVTVDPEGAREAAHEAERAVKAGEELGPLHGVPVGIKDLQPVKGLRTTYGSKLYAEYVPDEDGLVVEQFRDAGAIVLGKTNTPEFGLLGTTDNLVFGPTGTPFDPNRNAGGSSGGSAAAVAAGMSPIAQGSDGGGSLRIPAAHCGVVGFKPSFGRIPYRAPPNWFVRHTPFLHAGVLTRTVEDTALCLDVLAGPHRADPFTLPEDGTDYRGATHRGVDGLSIAYSPDLGTFRVDDRVRAVIDEAVEGFEALGADIDHADPSFGHSREEILEAFNVTFDVAFAHLAEHVLDGIDERFDDLTAGVAESIEAGRNVSAVEYRGTELVRTDIFRELQSVLSEHDLLVTPTLAVPPFENDGDSGYREDVLIGPQAVNGQPIDDHQEEWTLCHVMNMSGHPAISIPGGFTENGLPVGLQIVGQRFADDDVLAAAAAYERLHPWHDAYDELG